jgi:cystathionine beta-synthase
MWHDSILDTIGNTPLVRLNALAQDAPCTVLGKVEFFNPGGSVKDRIGLQLIEDAEEKGLIEPGGTIIEGTSGNTGAGLAITAIAKGYQCIFTTTDKQSQEKASRSAWQMSAWLPKSATVTGVRSSFSRTFSSKSARTD